MSAPSSVPELPGADPHGEAAATLRICAILPEAETALSTLQCAVAAARAGLSKICAVHVGFDPEHTFVSAEEQDIQQLRDLYEGEPRERTARIKAIFDGFVAAAPGAPPMFWRNDEGDIPANVVLEAQRTDLVVIGRP